MINLIVIFYFCPHSEFGLCVVPSSRAAAIPRAKGGTLLQMKLVYNHLAPLFLLFLQWMDCSCAGFLHRYLNLFHILVYKVSIYLFISVLLFWNLDNNNNNNTYRLYMFDSCFSFDVFALVFYQRYIMMVDQSCLLMEGRLPLVTFMVGECLTFRKEKKNCIFFLIKDVL